MLFSSSFSNPYKKNIALCKEATSFERRECLACLGAKVLHRSVRMSRMPRCEYLACLDARGSKFPFFLSFDFAQSMLQLDIRFGGNYEKTNDFCVFCL